MRLYKRPVQVQVAIHQPVHRELLGPLPSGGDETPDELGVGQDVAEGVGATGDESVLPFRNRRVRTASPDAAAGLCCVLPAASYNGVRSLLKNSRFQRVTRESPAPTVCADFSSAVASVRGAGNEVVMLVELL